MASNGKFHPVQTGLLYVVRLIPGKGYGCFASMPLKRGVRILEERPLLVVPKANYLSHDIQAAFDALHPAQRQAYFELHSGHGQDPARWPSRIHESVSAYERQRIKEQHDARVGKEATLISIFQVNCMECDGGAAVFQSASRFNHSCNPNACFTWNSALQKETIHAMRDIAAGEEITLSYCDMTHDKQLRAWELKHYGFVCDCRACTENEDDEGSFAYQSAMRRFRLQELDRETRYLRGRKLEEGAKEEGFVKKLLEMAALHKQEGDWTARLANMFLDLALVCELKGDLKMAEVTAAKAVEVKQDCQGDDFPEFGKYEEVLKRIRVKLGAVAA